MTSTTKKHCDFVSGPIGEKDVTKLPGIGRVFGRKFKQNGFDKAYVVLGYFLLLKKDKEMFVEWIQGACDACTRSSNLCYNCLKDWCDQHL